MNNSNHQITVDEAQTALESLEVANKTTVGSLRPPLWLVLVCSASLGIKTTAMGLMINNSLWHSIQWGSYLMIFLSFPLWIAVLWRKGIAVKIADVDISKKGIVSALLICVLLVSSRAIYLYTESHLFPYIVGVLNASVLAYALYFNLRVNAKGKEKNSE